MFLHGCKNLCTEITTLLLVALFLAVLPLSGLGLIRFLRLFLAFLLSVGALLAFL